MASSIYQYVLELNDKMSGTLQKVGATGQSTLTQLEAQSKGVTSAFGGMKNILGTLGVGFGMFQLVSMTHQGVEKAHELHQAIAQVKAGLQSTGNAAGLTFEEIEKSAKAFSGASLYGRSEILKMQSVLLTFPKVTKQAFDPASQAILDMSTRMGMDVSHAAVMVGKALQDPVNGVMMMRRVGVNFTKEQVDGFKQMVASGDLYGAQMKILAELQTEFGGSAKAAYDADPLAKYNKLVGGIKLGLGEAAMTIVEKLTPALESMAELFKTGINWAGKHKTAIALLGNAFLTAGLAIAGYMAVVNAKIALQKLSLIWQGIEYASINLLGDAYLTATIPQKLFAAAQWAINAAMEANPIGLIIGAIAALGFVVYKAIDSYNKWGAALLLVIAPVVNVIMALKNNWESISKAFKEGGIIAGIKRIGIVLLDAILYPVQQLLQLLSKIPGLGKLANGGVEFIQKIRTSLDLVTPKAIEETDKQKKAQTKTNIGAFNPNAVNANADGGSSKAVKDTAKGITGGGSRPTNINITLKNLVETLQVNSANLTEGANEIEVKVREALLRVLNSANGVAYGK